MGELAEYMEFGKKDAAVRSFFDSDGSIFFFLYCALLVELLSGEAVRPKSVPASSRPSFTSSAKLPSSPLLLSLPPGTVVGVATLPFVWSVAEEVSTEELVAASVVTAADVPVFLSLIHI